MATTIKTLGATTVAALTTREGNEFCVRVPILTCSTEWNRSVVLGWNLSNVDKFLNDAVTCEVAIGAAQTMKLKLN